MSQPEGLQKGVKKESYAEPGQVGEKSGLRLSGPPRVGIASGFWDKSPRTARMSINACKWKPGARPTSSGPPAASPRRPPKAWIAWRGGGAELSLPASTSPASPRLGMSRTMCHRPAGMDLLVLEYRVPSSANSGDIT